MYVVQILKAKGRGVVTMPPDASVADIARRLESERIGVIIVSADGETVDGIVSERDIVRGLAEHGAELLQMPVAGLMTRSVVTCTPEDSADDLMRQMTARRIRHIPVVCDGILSGIVSIGDLVKCRLDDLEAEAGQLRSYIASS